MNVLILSAGTRVKVVRYFREELEGRGRVVATDMSLLAPAIYEADEHLMVPPMTDPGYLDVVLGICREKRVDGVLSLIDPELSLLAEHEADFAAVGTRVIGSPYAQCETALDKMALYRWLSSRGYRCARSWDDLGEVLGELDAGTASLPLFVKPVRGSASVAVSKVDDREELGLLFRRHSGLMAQELLDGREIGADVYVDMVSGEVTGMFTKWKLKMRAGETDKAESFRDPALFDLLERLVLEAGYRGPVDVDVFEVGGEYCVSEVNPRFGGGYPFAHECGCDHVSMILENLAGRANRCRIGDYEEGVCMAKWSEVSVVGSDFFNGRS